MTRTPMQRRSFLKVSALAGGGIALGLFVPGCSGSRPTLGPDRVLIPNAWLRIFPNNDIVVVVDRVEMGQGTVTGSAMMVAEELEVDPSTLKWAFAPADPVYKNNEFRMQTTGGSTSTKSSWLPLREAAAAARELFISAAAIKLKVDKKLLRAEYAHVIAPGGRKLSYGSLTNEALDLRAEVPPLKPKSEYKVIGQSIPRLDAEVKSTGKARYGLDTNRQGALSAVVVRAPVIGGTLVSFDGAAAMKVPGVKHVVQIPSGVAVAATDYWAAKKGAALVEAKWDDGDLATFDSDVHMKMMRDTVKDAEGHRAHEAGDVTAALTSGTAVSGCYEVPYMAHAPMEPMNCTAHVTANQCDVWAPTQGEAITQEIASRISGLPYEKVNVHVTYLGGGFGRRSMSDFVAEAVSTSKAIGVPVKLTWSREDDMRHGYFRPAAIVQCDGAVDKNGKATAWRYRLASQSVLAGVSKDLVGAIPPEWMPYMVKDYLTAAAGELLKDGTVPDTTTLEGAESIPYAIANQEVDFVQHEPGIPVGFWRSVGHSINGFVVESFIDELAFAAQKDPLTFRQALLRDAPRQLGVLNLMAKNVGWTASGPPKAEAGQAWGLAQHSSFGSHCAIGALCSVKDGEIRVHKTVCAVDCGTVINPEVVSSQMDSGIIYGLSATLHQRIDFKKGATVQSNFHDFPLLRINETPVMETYFVDSAEDPSGVGEISVPPLPAAVGNAVFALTGQRVRTLPMKGALA